MALHPSVQSILVAVSSSNIQTELLWQYFPRQPLNFCLPVPWLEGSRSSFKNTCSNFCAGNVENFRHLARVGGSWGQIIRIGPVGGSYPCHEHCQVLDIHYIIFPHYIFEGSTHYYYAYFTDEETETQKHSEKHTDEETDKLFQCLRVPDLVSNPCVSLPLTCAHNHSVGSIASSDCRGRRQEGPRGEMADLSLLRKHFSPSLPLPSQTALGKSHDI